jgi:hypothetical protein
LCGVGSVEELCRISFGNWIGISGGTVYLASLELRMVEEDSDVILPPASNWAFLGAYGQLKALGGSVDREDLTDDVLRVYVLQKWRALCSNAQSKGSPSRHG